MSSCSLSRQDCPHCNRGILQWYRKSQCLFLFLCTRAPSNGTGGGGKGSICVASLSRVQFPTAILRGTPITLLTASLVPPVLMFYPPDFSRSEHTFSRSHEAVASPSSWQPLESPSLAQPSRSYGLQLSVPVHKSKAKLRGTPLAALTFAIDVFCRTESSYK